MIEEQPKICEWIPLEEKIPENGERVLLSFANEKQKPLVGTWKVDDEGGAFYAPFTGRTYASLGCFVTAWIPLPEPYRPDDSMKDGRGEISIMTGSCPILFENKQEEYGLTDKEVEKFCQEGCSVDCDILLKQYVERLNEKKGAKRK